MLLISGIHPNRMFDKELCINCKHPVTFDGYVYKHYREQIRHNEQLNQDVTELIECYCCTGTNTIAVTNPRTKIPEIMQVGCICINPKGKQPDLESRGVTQYGKQFI